MLVLPQQPLVHVPQFTERETRQRSVPVTVPHVLPSREQNAGSLSLQPQTLGTLGLPPPQVCGDVHVPQFTVPPVLHPSGTVPQFFFAAVHA